MRCDTHLKMKNAIGNEKVGKNEDLYFHSINIFDIFSIFNSFCFRNNQIFLSPEPRGEEERSSQNRSFCFSSSPNRILNWCSA